MDIKPDFKDAKKERKQTIKLYKDYLAKYKQKYYKRLGLDIIMGPREGIYFHDFSGKRYINCHSNGGVFNLGHRNPKLRDVMEQVINYVDIGNHHFISKSRASLASSLVKTLPDICHDDYRVLYGVSGGEAIDTAIKLARAHTTRKKVVSIVGGYHGHTGLALAAGDPKYRDPFYSSSSDFQQVAFGDLTAMDKALDEKTAAVILETIPATLGMIPFPKEYIQKVRTWTTERGIVLILDEIQTGLGRTGKFWGFEHYGICPDITVLGKGLSGGIYPITATLYKEKYESVFKDDPFIHISTFGGAEIGTMIAEQVVEISKNSEFLQNVTAMGLFFNEAWQDLQSQYSFILEIRQTGLFMGIVLDRPSRALLFLRELMRNGIFAVYANNDKKVVQFLPPLIISKAEAMEVMELVAKTLKSMQKIHNKLLRKIIAWKFDTEDSY